MNDTQEAQCLNVKASCAVDTTPVKWRLQSIQLPPNPRADLTLLPTHQPSLYEKMNTERNELELSETITQFSNQRIRSRSI